VETANPVVEMAGRFVEYADLVVGFVVVQGLAFVFALGKDDEDGFGRRLRESYNKIRWVIPIAGLLYLALVIACACGEVALHRWAGHPESSVIKWASIAFAGRAVVVVAVTVLCSLAMYWNRPKK
jgi:hypothetical protein